MSHAQHLTRGAIAVSAFATLLATGCSSNTVPTASLPSNTGFPANATMMTAPTGSIAASMALDRSSGPSGAIAYNTAVQQDKPVAFYALNDLTTQMTDASGNGINGTYGSNVVHGGAPITDTGARSSSFPGGSYDPAAFAAAPINPLLQPAHSVTVEAWVEESAVNSTNTFVPIIAYGKQSQGPSYSLTLNPQNAVRFWARTTTGSVSAAGLTFLQPGVPYHVAATYDGSTVSIYVNGRLEGSSAGSGDLYYKSLTSRDGLGISGSLDKGSPQFTGAISEAAVYGTALSAAAIKQHYVVGHQTPLLVERAQNANKFIDSIGVNVHLHYTGSAYDTQFPTIKSLLVDLGVRHIRDGLMDSKWQPYYDRLNELGRAGIRSTLTTSLDASPSLLTSYPSRVKDSFEAYEAPNEMDIYNRSSPNWPQQARDFQKFLYTTVKSNAQTAGFRVLGPSFTSGQSQVAVGDLSQYMDYGNFHCYFGGYNPGTDGWGSHTNLGIVGSIPWNMNVEKIVSNNRPLIATEVGYNTGTTNNNVPFGMQGKYLPRLMLEMFNHGVIRSMIYELLDWSSMDAKNNFGLVGFNMQPKPGYTALKSLIGLLKDSAPGFQTSVLQYSIGGDTANVHHTLLQKADGSYHLALWQEVRSYTPLYSSTGGGSFIQNAPQQVTVTLLTPPHGATIEAFDDNGNVTSTPATISGNTVTMNVTDDMSILKINP